MKHNDRTIVSDSCDATVTRGAALSEFVTPKGFFTVICIGPDGIEKWRDEIHNLITTVGKNLIADKILGNSAAGAVVMGLKGTGSAAAGDTQASHAGWLEVGGSNAPTYSGNRQTPSFSAASGGVKSTSSNVSFAMTGSGTIAGCFINIGGSSTKDDTTATLFSAGDFTGGNKIVTSGDTMNIGYSFTVA